MFLACTVLCTGRGNVAYRRRDCELPVHQFRKSTVDYTFLRRTRFLFHKAYRPAIFRRHFLCLSSSSCPNRCVLPVVHHAHMHIRASRKHCVHLPVLVTICQCIYIVQVLPCRCRGIAVPHLQRSGMHPVAAAVRKSTVRAADSVVLQRAKLAFFPSVIMLPVVA